VFNIAKILSKVDYKSKNPKWKKDIKNLSKENVYAPHLYVENV